MTHPEQLIFGQISRAEAEKKAGITHQENPCVALYGKDAMGRSCRYCSHLYAKQLAKRYYKCDLRKNTCGLGTDHRVNWPACGRYERRLGI